jgi:hypothetical protein
VTKEEKQRFAGIISGLGALFKTEVSPFLLRAYAAGLKGLTLDEIEAAAMRAVERCKFMPRPAELLELAGQATGSDRAAIAWVAVGKAVRSRGYRRSVDFDDPVVNAAIRSIGGWETLCRTPAAEFDTFRRSDFVKAYQSFERAGAGGEAIAYLTGADERECPEFAPAPAVVPCGLPAHRTGVIKAAAPVGRVGGGGEEVRQLVGQVLDGMEDNR